VKKRFSEFGYQFFDVNTPPPQGLQAWPTVFCYPDPPQLEYNNKIKPCIVSLIMEHQVSLSKFKNPVYFSEEMGSTLTYFITQVENRMYLVVLYNKKKKQTDQATVEFINDMAAELRNWKIFTLLSSR